MHLFTAFALLASTQRRRGPALARRGAAAAADDGRLPSEPLPPWLDGVDEELCRGTLTAREADVVVARFFRAGRPSQLDVSLALGLSLSRTSILERAARDKLAALLDERSDLEPATFDRFQAQGALLLGYFVAQVGFFYCKEDLGLDEATLARIVYLHGDVIAQRRDTIKAKGDAIKDALGLSTPVLAKLVAAQPTVLSLSVETLGRASPKAREDMRPLRNARPLRLCV
ncbi:hypothetical protein M885DRAFT_270811 [Pelagophyceae sp. CCMP2097]|nr:hypothetical protein M885DRAFT_270811 [Pelagophyceae sp. CCMP2097]